MNWKHSNRRGGRGVFLKGALGAGRGERGLINVP